MDSVSNSTYMKVQVEVERTRVRLFHLGEDSDSDMLERQVWARKERVIQAALHLLDCFIPLHYQKLDESWLIGKFFGAIYDIVRGSVSPPAYLLNISLAILIRLQGSKYTSTYLDNIESILSCFVKIVDRIHAGVARNSNERPAAPMLPPSLVHGFPPLIFLVCICSQSVEKRPRPGTPYKDGLNSATAT